MKIIVAGGRTFNNYELLCAKLDCLFKNITPVIICGEARGADSLGRRYAEERKLEILSYPANWDKYGKAAGYIRNKEMRDQADGLVAFWDGNSKGTADMIRIMKEQNKPVKVVKY